MLVLHRILQARHGKRPLGHWVVMKTTIAEVEPIAIACAWSQRGVAYFISSCGSTEIHDEKHASNYEDDYGNITYKEINKPNLWEEERIYTQGPAEMTTVTTKKTVTRFGCQVYDFLI